METPSGVVCEKMELREGTPVYCFTRVRNVDGEPLILETSYYPQYIYPNLTRDMLQTHSFYSLLYHVGIVPFAADESYEAVILDSERAALLGVEPRKLRLLPPAPDPYGGWPHLRVHPQLYPRRPGTAGRTYAEERHELRPHHRLRQKKERPAGRSFCSVYSAAAPMMPASLPSRAHWITGGWRSRPPKQ